MKKSEIQKAIKHLKTNDKILEKIIDSNRNFDIEPDYNYYESLLQGIISQQLSVKAGATLVNKFVDYFGGDISPERIITATPEELRSIGLSRQKSSYVKDLSEKIVNNEIQLENIDKLSDSDITKLLTKVKGIGTWTAHMFLMFTLVRPNILPVGDLGIKKAVANLYEFGEYATEEEIKLTAEKNNWFPYCTVASWYLWRSLEKK